MNSSDSREKRKKLARLLTIVENDLEGATDTLKHLKIGNTPVIGITGPPGAGKSTLIDALLSELSEEKQIAVLAVDPSSPFNLGSLLGDRVRMSSHFNNNHIFIRSVAARGSLGGLSAKTIEMTDVLKSYGFDYIFVETVGVGQSEVEIAGLADISIVVLVPESGDEIQNIKSGLMEIADIFVVNKSDREGAQKFSNRLKQMIKFQKTNIPVLATVAHQQQGIRELIETINASKVGSNDKKLSLLAQKAWHLIQNEKMKSVDMKKLQRMIAEASLKPDFNLYQFIEDFKHS